MKMKVLSKESALVVYLLSLGALIYFVNSKPDFLLSSADTGKDKKPELSGLFVAVAFVISNLVFTLVFAWLARMYRGSSAVTYEPQQTSPSPSPYDQPQP